MEGVEGMDQKSARMSLIRDAMPGVANLVREKRRLYGDTFVTDCLLRGMAGEPGFFFAREGTLAVGTPWGEVADIIATWLYTPTQALLIMKTPEASDGA